MIFNKIKLNYNLKYIDDCFRNNDFDTVKEILNKNQKNKVLYSQLLSYINKKYLSNHLYKNFYNQKILWIVSFDLSDTDYLLKFLNYYFNKVDNHNIYFSNYKKFVFDGLKPLIEKKSQDKILFEDIAENSNLYQTSALLNHEKKLCILSTSSAFFETASHTHFASPLSTLTYLHIVRNPLQIYLKNKNEFQSAQAALNFLNNADQDPYSNNFQNDLLIPENKQNWNINTQSWIDENVVSTFKGKTIKFEDLINNNFDILVDLLFHIKQAGWVFDIDYEIIMEFVKVNENPSNLESNISNQELKLLSNCLETKILNKFDYQL